MLENLSTAHLADGCLRVGVQPRCVALAPVTVGMRVAGPARVVRHYGSVDIFLEMLEAAAPGNVLVVDNAGRRDESCVGDLVTIEVKHAGLAGIVIWDTIAIPPKYGVSDCPSFSLGAVATGPVRLDARDDLPFGSGSIAVADSDFVVADDDGASLEPIAQAARGIRETEVRQASRVQTGNRYVRSSFFGILGAPPRQPGVV